MKVIFCFRYLIVFNALLSCLYSCVHFEIPHRGIIMDADTGRPIKGAVVHLDIESAFFIPSPEGLTDWKDSYETVTNKKGKYSLPMKIYGLLPLEFTTAHSKSLSFFKAGYFSAVIGAPSAFKHKSVNLYKIKHYLDYLYCKERKRQLLPSYADRCPECFAKYKNEVNRIESLQIIRHDEKGVFLEVPGSRLTRLLPYYKYESRDYSVPYTFGVNGQTCFVFDEYSDRWLSFDSQGNISNYDNMLASQYEFFSFGPGDTDRQAVYASQQSIYLPAIKYLYPEKYVAPQQGNISTLVGFSDRYLTIEKNGQYLCYMLLVL